MSTPEERFEKRKPHVLYPAHKIPSKKIVTPDDLGRRLVEVREQERQTKQVLKETADRTLDTIRKDIGQLIKAEEEDATKYSGMSKEYGIADWRSVFSKIALQELNHVMMLRDALRAAEREFAQYGK